jgi:hypothetical protein
MPGKLRCYITDKEEFNCYTLGATATVLNFSTVYLNIEMVTDEKTIGSKMYNYTKDNSISTDRCERKLTQILNTNDKSFVISNYYLWFFLDNCYFKIDDIEEMFIY